MANASQQILLTVFRWYLLWFVLALACPRRCCYPVKVLGSVVMGQELKRKAHQMSYHLGLPAETSFEFLSGQLDILKQGEVVSLFLEYHSS